MVKRALHVNGVIRGHHEVAKHIDASITQVVFLAESVAEQNYMEFAKGLCFGKNVPLNDLPDSKMLSYFGEFAPPM